MKNHYYISAYSTSPCVNSWDSKLESSYFQALAQCPEIIGIEHPYSNNSDKYPLAWLRDNIPDHWSFCITAIPSLMQLNQTDPYAGLASTQEAGRQKALKLILEINQHTQQLNQLFGRKLVKAIHLQSSPKNDDDAIRGDKAAFKRSLAEILQMDWCGAALNIEHCDAFKKGQVSKKGYLALQDEIEILKELGNYGMVLNWARSVIEYRSTEGALKQLQQVLKANLLRGYVFSGCTDKASGFYANWQDRHMPPASVEKSSLLTREQIKIIFDELKPKLAEIYLGIKVHGPAEQASLEKSCDMNFQTLAELNAAQILLR